jgi:hypothetical protein
MNNVARIEEMLFAEKEDIFNLNLKKEISIQAYRSFDENVNYFEDLYGFEVNAMCRGQDYDLKGTSTEGYPVSLMEFAIIIKLHKHANQLSCIVEYNSNQLVGKTEIYSCRFLHTHMIITIKMK